MIQFVVICVYLVALIGIGLVANRFLKSTRDDYSFASHTIGPLLLLLTVFGTTMTAFALIGSTAESFRQGMGIYALMASASGIVHPLCFYLVGLRLWAWGRRYGYATQVDFFRHRLQSEVVALTLFPILVALLIPYLLIGIMGAGAAIQTMTVGAFPDTPLFANDNPDLHGAIPQWLGELAVCVVVSTYVFFGGMRGTAWANAMQTLVFMVLGVVTFFVIAQQLGGHVNPIANFREAISNVPQALLTRENMSRSVYLSYLLIPLSAAMFPHLFQHWLTARSSRAFKVTIVWFPICIMIVWIPCVMLGVWAGGLDVPQTIRDNPNNVLPYLVRTYTPAVIGGLLTAGVLAAIMSSLDSQFLCIGTIFTNDVARRLGAQRWSERHQIWLSRLFILAVVAVAYGISRTGDRSVFGMAIWCFSGFSGLFPLVIAAIYWRRLTAAGAFAGLLSMLGLWGYYFYDSGFGATRSYYVSIVGWEDSPKFLPVLPIILGSAAVMIVVSLVTRPPPSEVLDRFYPRKYRS